MKIAVFFVASLVMTATSGQKTTTSKAPIDCSLVRCAAPPPCPNGTLAKLPGGCCKLCLPKPDCSAVLCAKPLCENPITPPGQCCPQCRCPPNFQFMKCATCNSTCANPRLICTAECKPASCVCRYPFALDSRGRCILARQCVTARPTCVRSSYSQLTKDLTRYTSCIPALVDVGTCRGTCPQVPFFGSRICRLCDVTEYATQTIRCRNIVGNLVPVKVDVVKKCGCTNNPTTSVGIPSQTPRPTARPTRRPTRRPVTCRPDPPPRPVCLRWLGLVPAPAGFGCFRGDTDAVIDNRLNAACVSQYGADSFAISGADIRAENANPGSIECLPSTAPKFLVPRCPYCGGCDCDNARICALGNSTLLQWNNVDLWNRHSGSVLRAGCVKPCEGLEVPCL